MRVPRWKGCRPLVYWALGRKSESAAALRMLTEKHASDDAKNIASAHAYRGEVDAAFQWLDRAYAQHDLNLIFIKCDPKFRSLRGDPRYKAPLRKIKLPE